MANNDQDIPPPPPPPIPGGSGLNRQQPQQNQPAVAVHGNNDAAQLARQIQANTNVTMKTEVVKLPDFYGEPGKDTITVLEFMARIDECQVNNEWNDITTFSYFRLALRGQADKWLSSIVRHMQLNKHGPASDRCSKQNLPLSPMTNSSLMALQSLHTGPMKI
jgi:hypothetical protein